MDWSLLVAAAAVAGVIVVVVRNGRNNAKSSGAFEQKVEGIKDILKDEHTGLGAINQKVADMQTSYSTILATHAQKIKNLEGEVFNKKHRSKANEKD